MLRSIYNCNPSYPSSRKNYCLCDRDLSRNESLSVLVPFNVFRLNGEHFDYFLISVHWILSQSIVKRRQKECRPALRAMGIEMSADGTESGK